MATKAAYDIISQEYKKWQASLKRKCTLEESFFKYLGSVEGRDVLDLACGEGCYTRRIKRLGANKVVGVDISAKMLSLAKSQEKVNPLGIEYKEFNVAELPKIGEFDIASAAYLLHYSKTKEELAKICKNICANLKKSGRFIALNLNPSSPLQPDKKYDSTIESCGPLNEGCVIKVTAYLDGQLLCSFDNYHWEKKTYETALKDAGFKDISWNGIVVSSEGAKKFGAKFWDNYLKNPGLAVLCCTKE